MTAPATHAVRTRTPYTNAYQPRSAFSALDWPILPLLTDGRAGAEGGINDDTNICQPCREGVMPRSLQCMDTENLSDSRRRFQML